MTDDEIFYGKPGVTYHGLNGSVTIPQPVHAGLIERLTLTICSDVVPQRGSTWCYKNPDGPEAAAALATKDAEIAALSDAVKQCREQFAFYADEHRKAGKDEKAATNQRFADMCEAALSSPTDRT